MLCSLLPTNSTGIFGNRFKKEPRTGSREPIRGSLGGAANSMTMVLQTSADLSKVCSSYVVNFTECFQADLKWRLVGLMSNAVGLPCYALSPSFTCLIGGWNYVKSILYVVVFLVIQATIYYGKQSSLFSKPPWLKNLAKFVVFILISVYSTRYDKCLDGKPEILSMVSNAVLALMSLSLSRLINLGCEKGIFSYFLGCFAAQLYTASIGGWFLLSFSSVFHSLACIPIRIPNQRLIMEVKLMVPLLIPGQRFVVVAAIIML